jgi:RimJ/RimL family protein N-acetyltransferase
MVFQTSAAIAPLRLFATRFWHRCSPSVPQNYAPQLRRLRSDDGCALTALLLGLSARSCRMRYSRAQFASAEAAAETRRLLDAARGGDVVIIAVASAAGGEQIVGVGELARSGSAAELALLVADHRQHEGIGKQLVAALQRAAESEGIARIQINTLEENHAMCALARRLGLFLREWHEHGEVHFTASL